MKTVIIRDDDTHAFTSSALLDKIYGPSFFRRGFNVSVSVIPMLDTSARIGSKNNSFYRRGYEYEPFIPKSRINSGFHDFRKNSAVSVWLKKKSVEPCLHGYSHDIRDFSSPNYTKMKEMLARGKSIVEGATKRKVRVFVPPHERLSKSGWRAVADSGFRIFRNVIRPLKDAVVSVPLGEYGLSHVRGNFLYGYNGLVQYKSNKELGTMNPYLFSCFWDLKQSFEDACKKFDSSHVFIMANHHWEFLINTKMHRYWSDFVDYMAQHDFASMTASEAFAKLKPVNA
ncbi:MAG: hypothetical protein HY365_00710 [Candidatus Aenigmarchaeota archaeon]|nr:hypothetical protein [Candidatus Aenigmarchaeota archaeon]